MDVLNHGNKSNQARKVQAATNRRLRARDLDAYVCREDGVVGVRTLTAVRKAAWALGAANSTLDDIARHKHIPVGVQRMVLNPSKRNDRQQKTGKIRLAHWRAHRKHTKAVAASTTGGRRRFVQLALEAAANYQKNPGAYHYFAGGVANLIFLKPSPRNYRSDCSQFASSVQHAAGLPDLGKNGPLWVSTYSMAAYLEETEHPSPADFGMYGPRSAPHHVETYTASLGHEFVGHGSPPIDSLTPGRPDFYLKNPL